MPANQGAVGIQNNPDSSNLVTARLGKQGDQSVSELHGRYYEQAYRNNIFSVASQAGVTTTVGLALTYTGLVVANPIGSGVNLVLNKATLGQSVVQAVVNTFGLAVGFSATTNVTLTTAAIPQTTFIGSGKTSKAVAAISATLPVAPLYYDFVASAATATNDSSGIIDLEGSLILGPGAYALWVSAAASSASAMWFSFQWEENPV
jgi:hypothetical protein